MRPIAPNGADAELDDDDDNDDDDDDDGNDGAVEEISDPSVAVGLFVDDNIGEVVSSKAGKLGEPGRSEGISSSPGTRCINDGEIYGYNRGERVA